MIKLLLGGSPCTFWTAAQTKNRETEAHGLGWELFNNYAVALEKYKPDYFLYENNKSASPQIKEAIADRLKVFDPSHDTVDNGVRMTHIDSALVSAQTRKRFYVTNFGDIEQPEDRGILLSRVLEDGIVEHDKGYCCKHQAGNARDYFKKHHTNIKFEPVNATRDGKSQTVKSQYYKTSIANLCCYTSTYGASGVAENIAFALPTQWDANKEPTRAVSQEDGKEYKVYHVSRGQISVNGASYPTTLLDGHYIIRKFSVRESARLQTIPDWFEFPVSDTQAFKQIGNGWTIEVIKFLLSHIPNIHNEEIEVLSMYDGMSCGQIALKEMGCNVIRYFASEIDKYAIQTTLHNFPDTIEIGDAFDVHNENFLEDLQQQR